MPASSKRIVSIHEAARIAKVSVHTLGTWANAGYIRSRGLVLYGKGEVLLSGKPSKGKLVRSFRVGDVLAAIRFYIPGDAKSADYRDKKPPGHATLDEACLRLDCSRHLITRLLRIGQLRAKRVRAAGLSVKKREYVYIEIASIDEYLARLRKPQGIPQLAEVAYNPLIHPDDAICLEARRKLWEERGCVLTRKYRISVDDLKEAG